MANAEVGPTNRRMVTAATAAVMSVATAEVAGGGGEGAAQHAHEARAVVPRRMVAPTVKDKLQNAFPTFLLHRFCDFIPLRPRAEGAKPQVEPRHKRHTPAPKPDESARVEGERLRPGSTWGSSTRRRWPSPSRKVGTTTSYGYTGLRACRRCAPARAATASWDAN
mmetsp:Transcript_104838/g.302461  ORF Transcript_104838/g.302461 Transcript_104838/m.302461 type:complete len:166 (+) Transcript_104838:346-843(+)